MFKSKCIVALALILFVSTACDTAKVKSDNHAKSDSINYRQVNLVANRAEFKPEILNPDLQNAWGIADRPAGAGGHFWITTQKTGQSIEYVGDVNGKKLFQDPLKTVFLVQPDQKPETPTGVVFNPAKNFIIDQPSASGAFTSESKFIFATDTGRIYGWAEKKNEDGTFNRPANSVLKVDHHKLGDYYYGLAMDSKGEKLFVADFGKKPKMEMFDSKYKEIHLKANQFKNPFIKGRYTKAGEMGPYNVQVLVINGVDHVFVAYAEIEKDHKTGKLEPGEEQKGAGLGRLVQYSLDGKLEKIWQDKGMLNAPWGMAMAPATGFGKYSGMLLVANFGDGKITVFNPSSFEAVAYLQSNGKDIAIDGIWGLLFGNGASLGEANHLYFTAGPNDETDGIFGKIVAEGN